jgi:hypothetical protein
MTHSKVVMMKQPLDVIRLTHGRTLPDTPCTLWTGRVRKDGYGVISIEGKERKAHRVLYERTVGLIPDGMELHHRCRNRTCVRLDHLMPVTRREHCAIEPRDLMSDRNRVRTQCSRGHELSKENLKIRASGARVCRICLRSRDRKNKKRKRETDPGWRTDKNAKDRARWARRMLDPAFMMKERRRALDRKRRVHVHLHSPLSEV